MNFEVFLKDIGLYGAIENVQYGFLYSTHHLFSVLEMYNPKSEILFTPVSEFNFPLHEMFEVSYLSMGELPYEKMVPTRRN